MPDPQFPPGWAADTPARLHAALLTWFDHAKRPMPWRASRDPYRVWVSEVMLQQTTVAAAGPYYTRFIASFPTVTSLAAADEQAVLAHWAGLGYYRRARYLHEAAKRLAAGYGENLPDDPEVWADLPGVGRYILGAVMSQAFERRLPVVEANTLRVISRLFGSRLDPREGPGKLWVWAAAESILPDARIGDFNQALMELGALVCTPDNPRCGQCPAAAICEANRLGVQAEIPPKPRPKQIVEVSEVAVVIRAADRVLWCQRPPTAKRWASMWEVPHGEREPGESAADAAARVARVYTGLTVTPGAELATVKHGVTRFSITMVCVECEVATGEFTPTAHYTAGQWLTPTEVADLPVSSPQRKLAKELAGAGRQQRLF